MTIRPNLFVVGAAKAGTNSLKRALSAHPDIYMCERVEPTLFVAPDARSRELYGNACDEDECLRVYLSFFTGGCGKKYLGEASVGYAKAPMLEGSAQRIFQFNPGARIIYLVRDPVERTISHYWWTCRFEYETRGPLDAITADPQFLAISNYVMQMQRYLQCFPKDQVRLVCMEDIADSPREELSKLFAWLGLDASKASQFYFPHANSTPPVIRRPRFRFIDAFQETWVYERSKHFIPKGLRSLARRLNSQVVDRTSVQLNETRDYLRSVLREQVDELGDLFLRKFPRWYNFSPIE